MISISFKEEIPDTVKIKNTAQLLKNLQTVPPSCFILSLEAVSCRGSAMAQSSFQVPRKTSIQRGLQDRGPRGGKPPTRLFAQTVDLHPCKGPALLGNLSVVGKENQLVVPALLGQYLQGGG